MPSFNFQAQFVPAVESGRKRTTIRAVRKYPPRVGQTAYLFSGLRTALVRKLGEAPISKVDDISISEHGAVRLNGDLLTPRTLNKIAAADGFGSRYQLIDYFRNTHGLPFEGHLIEWSAIHDYPED